MAEKIDAPEYSCGASSKTAQMLKVAKFQVFICKTNFIAYSPDCTRLMLFNQSIIMGLSLSWRIR